MLHTIISDFNPILSYISIQSCIQQVVGVDELSPDPLSDFSGLLSVRFQ